MIRTSLRPVRRIFSTCERTYASEATPAPVPAPITATETATASPSEASPEPATAIATETVAEPQSLNEQDVPSVGGGGGGKSNVTTSKGAENRRVSDLMTANVEQSYLDRHKPNYNKYYLHCLTSHSNTLLTLTNYKHEPIMWTSAGLCGFKKAARGGYEAGFRSTTMMLEKMKMKEEDDVALELKSRIDPSRVQKTQVRKQKPIFRPSQIELVIKDFGLGREAVMKALMGVEGDHYRNKISNIIDATPLKFGGVRARAVRRL